MSSSYACQCLSGHEQALHPPPLTAQKDLNSMPLMKISPSIDSIGGGVKTCVYSPITHAGSFHCRLHRNSESLSTAHGHPPPLPPPQDPSHPLPPSTTLPSMAAMDSRTVQT